MFCAQIIRSPVLGGCDTLHILHGRGRFFRTVGLSMVHDERKDGEATGGSAVETERGTRNPAGAGDTDIEEEI